MSRVLLLLLSLLISPTLLASVPLQQWKTPKDIQVFFVPDQTTELVSINFAFKGAGARTDPKGKEGLTYLMVQQLFERTTEGSTKYDLRKKLKSLGVLQGIRYETSLDNIVFWFKCPKKNLKAAFDILNVYFKTPSFDQKELAKVKNYDPNNSRLSTTGEQQFASKILIKNFFASSPYAHPASGTLEGRQSITLNDLKQAMQERFARNNLVFSVIGNLSQKELSQYIDGTFGQFPKNAKLPTMSDIQVQTDGQIIVIPKDSPQSGVFFGQPGVPQTNPQFLPLLILNDILGGKPFTSRLWLDIREQQGLVYSIDTSLVILDHAALLAGSFESSNQTAQQVIGLIKQEWINVKNNGVTKEEFEAAKTGLQGRFVLNFTSPDGIAHYILSSYLDDLPADYINQRNELLSQITLEQVNATAKTLLKPEELSFVVVGNLE